MGGSRCPLQPFVIALALDLLFTLVMKQSRSLSIRAVPAVLFLVLAGGVLADRVYFKNGRSIEGVIQEERDDAVVLGLGLGSMTIKRDQIDRVERAAGTTNEEKQDEWRKRHFLHEKYVPRGLKELAATFRDLKTSRDSALKARKSLSSADKEEQALNRRMAVVAETRKALVAGLVAARPGDDVRAYNASVAKHNSLAAEVALLRGKLEEADKGRRDASRAISAYLDGILSFRQRFDAATGGPARRKPDEAAEYFLAQVEKRLITYEGDFSDAGVRPIRRGNSTFVRAAVNGKRQGLFLVDTGASLVALSHSFARELGLRVDSFPETQVVVADGRKVKARLTLLQSVKVGNTSIDNVRAVVMPGDVQKDVDGLLGMSYLRHFNIHLGSNGGELQLKRFAPE